MVELARECLIVYPRRPRPSYADQVLSAFKDRGLTPSEIHEVQELQTALGLIAAGVGIALVPASVQRLRRDEVVYRQLDETSIVSPIIMSTRLEDDTPELVLLIKLAQQIYADQE